MPKREVRHWRQALPQYTGSAGSCVACPLSTLSFGRAIAAGDRINVVHARIVIMFRSKAILPLPIGQVSPSCLERRHRRKLVRAKDSPQYRLQKTVPRVWLGRGSPGG